MVADRLPVLHGVLREQRRSLLVWAFALFAVSVFYIAFYPAIGDTPAMQEMIDSMPQGLSEALGYDRIGSAAGYIGATVFGLLAPVLLLVFGSAAGARMIAGEEEAGSLELELAHPVSRARLVAQRWAALAVDLLLLVSAVAVATLIMVAALDLDVAPGNVLAICTALYLFALAFSSLALAVGAATGRRAIALGVTAAIAVTAYLANALGPQLENGGWMEAVSPFAWYLGEDPLVTGWDPQGLALLVLVPVVAVPVALVTFARRDFGT